MHFNEWCSASARLRIFLLIVISAFLFPGCRLGFGQSDTRERVHLGSLPLVFEPAVQDSGAEFVSRRNRVETLFTKSGITFLLSRSKGKITRTDLHLVGANPDAVLSGEDQLPSRSNYLIGSDPSRWRTQVPNFGHVKYSGVYPGIDLIFYGTNSDLEHDFVLAPGANPRQIAFALTGAKRVSLTSHGALWIEFESGVIVFKKPIAYQETGNGRQAVPVSFARSRKGVRFKLGAYDRSRALTIDPVLTYSTYVAGSSGDLGQAIALDSQGNAYITGLTFSTNFPVTPGVVQSMCKSCAGATQAPDVFVSKLNANGTALLYSTYVGGSDYDQPSAIAVDSNGNAAVGGHTVSQDFPLLNNNSTWGVYPGANTGLHTHGFLFSLNATGTGFNFSTYVAGTGDDSVTGVALDSNGNIFAVGETDSPNFPVTPGALSAVPAYPLNDIFVMKLASAGALSFSALISPTKKSTSPWANYVFPSGIAVDSSDNVFITGFASDGFPTTSGTYQPAFNGNPNGQSYNAVVAKLDPAASKILAATYLGGSSQDEAKAIALDGSGNVYITGTANSGNFPTTAGAYETLIPSSSPNTACCASFVTKFDPALASLQYSTFLTGVKSSPFSNSFAIAVDSNGQAMVTGDTQATDFPLVNPIVAEPGLGLFGIGTTAFVTQFNSAGSRLLFSSYFGGSTGSHGMGVALDTSGAAYVTGTTNDTDLPTTAGAFQTSVPQPPQNVSSQHVFVAKIDIAEAGPSVCLSSSLNFGYVRVGTPSQPRTLTVTNCGNGTLSVTSVSFAAAGDFSETDNCTTASVAPGNSCAVQITFTPTVEAQRGATLLITSNTGVVSRVALSGLGAQPHVGALPGAINFDSMLIGVTTPVARSLIVQNVGHATLTLTGLTTTGDFAQTNSCPQTLLPFASCLVTLTFTPTAAGARTGTFTVTSDDPNGPATTTLNGTGDSSYPAPTITLITPNSAAAGSSNVQMFVNGTNFFPASVIQISGVAHATTYQSGSSLTTTLTASDLATMSEPEVTVSTPAPGGGTTAPEFLTVYLSLPITARGFTFDPYTRRLFAAVPSGATNYANSIVPIDPFTGNVGTGVPIGDDPAKTVVSNDGSYLYVVLNGDAAVRRYVIGSATADIQIGMPSDPTFGQTRAIELAVVPNDSHSFLATLQRSEVSPSEAGVALFTDSTLRTFLSNGSPGFLAPDTVRFMSDPTVAWGLENGNFLLKFSLGAAGLSLGSTQISSPIGGQIESDGTYLYSNFGQVYDPINQILIGKYANLNVGGSVLPDTPLQRTFFYDFGQFYAYDQSSFAQLGTINIGQAVGSSALARWGSDGVALAMINIFGDHTQDAIVIFRTRFARPNANTTLTPALVSLSPATQILGTGNFLMTVSGTNFVAGAVVLWNNTELTTKFVNSTTLAAYVSNADIGQLGTVQVSVKNPNSATSGTTNFTITGNLSLSASTVSLGSQLLATSPSGQSVTVKNTGSTPLNITGVTASTGFTQTNNCSALGSAASCTITVSFQPTSAGAATGVLTITASDGETLSVGLSGNGTDFGVGAASGSSTSASVKAGQAATFNLAVAPVSGFTGNVALSCSGAPALSQCTVSPASVTVGSGPASFAVTLSTTAPVAGMQVPSVPMLPPNNELILWAIAGSFAIFVSIRRPRFRPAFAIALACVALLPGCGGGGGNGNGNQVPPQNPQPGTPAGTYSLTVTAISQGVSRQTTLSVTVQ